jgi:hypothetical protein
MRSSSIFLISAYVRALHDNVAEKVRKLICVWSVNDFIGSLLEK